MTRIADDFADIKRRKMEMNGEGAQVPPVTQSPFSTSSNFAPQMAVGSVTPIFLARGSALDWSEHTMHRVLKPLVKLDDATIAEIIRRVHEEFAKLAPTLIAASVKAVGKGERNNRRA